jgi:hypothetical protein
MTKTTRNPTKKPFLLVKKNHTHKKTHIEDRSTTREKLLQAKWNPPQAKAGAWREYLVK